MRVELIACCRDLMLPRSQVHHGCSPGVIQPCDWGFLPGQHRPPDQSSKWRHHRQQAKRNNEKQPMVVLVVCAHAALQCKTSAETSTVHEAPIPGSHLSCTVVLTDRRAGVGDMAAPERHMGCRDGPFQDGCTRVLESHVQGLQHSSNCGETGLC